MYVMRLLTAADAQAAVALVQERVRALDARVPGRASSAPLRIAAFLGAPPGPGGCVAGLFEGDVLLAVLVLARSSGLLPNPPGGRALAVVDAYTHPGMRKLRLGMMLSMWISDHATRLTPPASQVTAVVHDAYLASYLCQMCAWVQDRHVRDAGRHAIVLHRPAERVPALAQAIATDPALITAVSAGGKAREGDADRPVRCGRPPVPPMRGGR
ncbi:hypothetical protein ACFWBX_06490 [Streptomyces sp. NPDC059991]|uniref:hypothetical protein n=1 Tax=Streptomyces sp. NPDC059991 TaxID=3347028 RepID=UPI0036C36E1E